MPDICDINVPKSVQEILEDMRDNLSKQFGVTLNGNRVTLRWYMGKQLVDVHMIVAYTTTPEETKEHLRRCEAMETIYKKHPELQAELYHAETGEWLK